MPALPTDGLTTQHIASAQGLQDHYNVSGTAPSTNDVLAWNGSQWVPTAPGAPGSHVLATTAGLGASHTTSGLTAGQVLRATGATTAAFQSLIAADIPSLDASKITTGTFDDARLSANVALENAANVFSTEQSFTNLAALVTWYGDASARLKLSYDTTANAWEWQVITEGGLDPVTLSIASATGVWNFATGALTVNGAAVLTGSHTHSAADITSGTLVVTRGGTGVSDPTSGNLLVGAGASAMTLLAPGAAGGYVRSSGTAWARSALLHTDVTYSGLTAGHVWRASGAAAASFAALQAGDLPAHNHVASDISSGTLNTSRGGTGVSDPTTGNLLVGAGSGALTLLAPGAAGGHVRSDGATWARSAGVPHGDLTFSGLTAGHVWRASGATAASFAALQAGDLPAHTHAVADITSGTFGAARGGTGNGSYVAGDMLYYVSGDTLQRLGIGGNDTFLRSTSTAPAWTAITAAHVGAGTFPGTGAYTFSGPVITVASATGAAGFRVPHGTAPSSPTNGDFWTTTAGVFVRINGATQQLTTASGSVLLAPSGVQTIVAGSQTSVNYALELVAAAATVGGQNIDSPPFVLRAEYWDGLATASSTWKVFADMSSAPSPLNVLTWQLDGVTQVRFGPTGGVVVGRGTLADAADELRLTPTGRSDGVKLRHVSVGNYALETTASGAFTIGAGGNLALSGATIPLQVATVTKWTLDASGHLVPAADGTAQDLGTSSARVRKTYTKDLALGIAAATSVGLMYHSGEFDNGSSGTSKTIDWTVGNIQKITATGTCTLTFTAPTGPTTLVLRIIANSTTPYTFVWPAAVKWAGGVSAPASPNVSGKWIVVTLYYDGTNYTAQYTGATG